MMRTIRMIWKSCVAGNGKAAETSGHPPRMYPQWRRDPLSHPALEATSMTQLADLAFDPRRIRRE